MVDIQYAIDVFSRDEALRAADTAAGAGVNCFEAGHVLVKAVGVGIVTELRARFPGAEIVADMKTMDMGRDEVAVAADAGAHLVIVCAAASDGVLLAAQKEAAARDVGLLVSLMGVRRRVERTRQLLDLGLGRVIAHRGIDDDFLWSDPLPFADLTELAGLPDIDLVLAGGVNASSVKAFSRIPVSRLIVGRGITDADRPREHIAALTAAAAAQTSSLPLGAGE
ncbi:orotidine 5'-phosphate decarboxylase / HUMPS family protein [Streptomyces sp. NPDC091267]|uniref:orotidine 5'-phosphate decarboxylase / HUMPS family protein n=1 Tax=Streptomyces sp. NPDC091267 TaxID=3155195 RepID=UPI003435D7DD